MIRTGYRNRRLGYVSTLLLLYMEKHGATSTDDLATGCGVSLNTVRCTMSRLRKSRWVDVRDHAPANLVGGPRAGRYKLARGRAKDLSVQVEEFLHALIAAGHRGLIPEHLLPVEVDDGQA